MVRHEKNLGATHVAWGYDEGMQGYFLTITDNRLGWREGQSAEVTKVCEKISEDGGGHYLDLNTYPVTGFGHKVSKETVFTFMKRYGIDPEEIGSTDTDTVGGGTKECAHPDCRMPETVHKRCARCKSVWYCSKACQTADWKTHKVDCNCKEA